MYSVHPSLDMVECCIVIEEQIMNGGVETNADVKEMALTLGVIMEEAELEREGLGNLVFKWRTKRGRKTTVRSKTVSGQKGSRGLEKVMIEPLRKPDEMEKKKMMAKMITKAIEMVMSSHIRSTGKRRVEQSE